METIPKIEELKSLSRSYSHLFTLEMQKISREASGGNLQALSRLKELLEECGRPGSWRRENRLCSTVVHAIIGTKTPESLISMIHYIRKLTPDTPFGAIELISSLLPVYKRFILGPAKEMAGDSKNEVIRAVGIQTLCNLYLEGNVSDEDSRFLGLTLEGFKSDRYFTQHYAELVRSAMRSRKLLREESAGGIDLPAPESENQESTGSKTELPDDLIQDILLELSEEA